VIGAGNFGPNRNRKRRLDRYDEVVVSGVEKIRQREEASRPRSAAHFFNAFS
jgi:hypothetical protein